MGQAPYFGEYVKQQLIRKLGAKRVFGSGFRVYTTIDLRLQKLANDAIHKWLPSPDGPQAALVDDQPEHRRGARDGRRQQLPRRASSTSPCRASASPARRSSRSCSRPRSKQGISPLTTFASKPVSIFLGNKYWNVHNYEGEYLGPIDLVEGDLRVRQLGVRAADARRRAGERRADGEAARHHEPAAQRTSRSVSARRR